jgi:hypothetical protein
MRFFIIKIGSFALFVTILNWKTMKDAVLQRVKELFDIKGFKSEKSLAEAIGIKQRTFNQQLTGQRALSLDTVLAILSTFDDLSAEWLLRGKGEVLDEDNMKRLSDYMAKSGEYNWKIWSVVDSSHGDINGENSKTSTQAAEDVTTNARSRISDLDKLINNKRYY